MDRKIIMGVAAVAGIGLLLYMRKNGDEATISGSASLVGASSVPWSSSPIVIQTNTKAPVVADGSAANPAPTPAPAPVEVNSKLPAPAPSSGGAVWGGTTGKGPQVTGVDNGSSYGRQGANGVWIWPDGTTTQTY